MLMSPDPISGKPLTLAQACARLRFRHLQFLDILGQTRNLRLTAEQMHVTQPAATKILMDIEEILEARLFERLSRGMRPNELGLFTLRYAASALAGHIAPALHRLQRRFVKPGVTAGGADFDFFGAALGVDEDAHQDRALFTHASAHAGIGRWRVVQVVGVAGW